MKIDYRVKFSIILMLIGMAGCAPKPIVTSRIGTIDSKNKLLIATQKSEFKEAIVSKVVKAFEGNNIFIEVIDVINLPNTQTNDYEAIVILSEYKFFQINQNVEKFLKSIDDSEKKKIVLLTTGGSPHLIEEGSEIDAISSASKMANTGTISNSIIQKVNGILSE